MNATENNHADFTDALNRARVQADMLARLEHKRALRRASIAVTANRRAIDQCAYAVANALAQEDANFDREKFLTTAGVIKP